MLISPHSNLKLSPKAEAKSLRFLRIEPTEKSNLNCIHCYNDSGPLRDLKVALDLTPWIRILYERI